jgi:hypothetical protein
MESVATGEMVVSPMVGEFHHETGREMSREMGRAFRRNKA